ncbi:MAG: ABC transporter permease [Tissierellia bacterium]|nr:ABC transporter permease [Tissierellia bacterium]
MIVFKSFLRICWKKRWIILLALGIFIGVSIMSSSVSTQGEYMDKALRIGISDNSKSELSNDLIKYLDTTHDITLEDKSSEEFERDIFNDKYDLVLNIYPDFEENVKSKKESISMILKKDTPSGVLGQQQIEKYLTFANALGQDGSIEVSRLKEALESKVQVNYLEQEAASYKQTVYIYFSASSYVISLLVFMAMGLVMTEFLNDNLSNRTSLSSKSSIAYQIELILGQLVLLLIIISPFFIYLFASQKDVASYMAKNLHWYLITVLLLGVSILSILNFLLSLIKAPSAISAIGNVMSLGFAFVSGAMVPRELLPSASINISKAYPIYYYINALEGLSLNSPNYGMVYSNWLVMLGMTVLFVILTIGVKRFTRK